DAPVAWGRGNGFAELGLVEVLTALPPQHPLRPAVLEIYRRQMDALRRVHDHDGMLWRQVIDEPGAYRELTVTAMIVTALARGVRFGWIDGETFKGTVELGWRALATRIVEDATLVDVCAGTGAGPTTRYYLDR